MDSFRRHIDAVHLHLPDDPVRPGARSAFECNGRRRELRGSDSGTALAEPSTMKNRWQTMCWSAVGVALAVLGVVTPRAALADEFSIGGDLDYVRARDPAPMSGAGFGIRLGPRLHVPFLVTAPEIGVNYLHLAGDRAPTLYRGTAGLRIGVGEILRPGVFGHLGIGRLDGVDGSQGADRTRTAFTWDAGVSLDVTFIPIVDVGAHASWGSILAPNAGSEFGWLMLGLHAAVIF